MRTIGVDISLTNCGVIVYDHGHSHNTFGSVEWADIYGYRMHKDAVPTDRVRRMQSIALAIGSAIDEYAPDFVVVEGPSYGSPGKQVEIGGLHYIVYAEIMKRRRDFIVMPPKHARLVGLGSGCSQVGGAATKKWVRARLEELIGKANVPKSEHVRDALVLCLAQQGWFA